MGMDGLKRIKYFVVFFFFGRENNEEIAFRAIPCFICLFIRPMGNDIIRMGIKICAHMAGQIEVKRRVDCCLRALHLSSSQYKYIFIICISELS